MSARRIAVLVGSHHDPAHFPRYTQPDRPGEAAVLTALRAQRATSEASHRGSPTQTLTDRAGRIARHVGARANADTQCAHVPDSGGPRRMSLFSAAPTRRPTLLTRSRILATWTAGT